MEIQEAYTSLFKFIKQDALQADKNADGRLSQNEVDDFMKNEHYAGPKARQKAAFGAPVDLFKELGEHIGSWFDFNIMSAGPGSFDPFERQKNVFSDKSAKDYTFSKAFLSSLAQADTDKELESQFDALAALVEQAATGTLGTVDVTTLDYDLSEIGELTRLLVDAAKARIEYYQ